MKCQHCLLLPFALILVGAGVVTLLYFGIGNLEPYTHTKDFRAATCQVISSNVSQTVSCAERDAKDPDKIKHWSVYPCLTVVVNYTEEKIQYDQYGYPVVDEPSYSDTGVNDSIDDEGPVESAILTREDMQGVQKGKQDKEYIQSTGIMLYDEYSSWHMERSGGSNASCSIHVCDSDYDDNEKEVVYFQKNHGQVGQHFTCYFNPGNHREVYVGVVSGNMVLHAMIWPALAIGFGVFLLVVVACLSCEVWICRNPKRAQRRMEGQTYELASYRESLQQQNSQRGWRQSPPGGSPQRNAKRTPKPDDGNNNSRMPKLSAAADIVRKWSLRGRSDRRSDVSDNNRTNRSFGGVPSREWSITKADVHFSTS